MKHSKNTLYHNINTLATRCIISNEFATTMHMIRDYGNKAAHGRYTDLPNRNECERVFERYRLLKRRNKGTSWFLISSTRRLVELLLQFVAVMK